MKRVLKVGIVCDNYKVEKFKNKLQENNFDIASESSFGKGNTLLKIVVFPSELNDIKKICTELEIDFTQSN